MNTLKRRLNYAAEQIRQLRETELGVSEEEAVKRSKELLDRMQIRARAELAEALRQRGKDVPVTEEVSPNTPEDARFLRIWFRKSRIRFTSRDKQNLVERLDRYDKGRSP